jgi:hypothetical protein
MDSHCAFAEVRGEAMHGQEAPKVDLHDAEE